MRRLPRTNNPNLQSVSSYIGKSFLYKWSVPRFNCEAAAIESLPSTIFAFQLGKDLKFVVELWLYGDQCAQRSCSLSIQSRSAKQWDLNFYFWLGDKDEPKTTFYLNQNVDKVNALPLADPKTKNCLLSTAQFIIHCEFSAANLSSDDGPMYNLTQQPGLEHSFAELFRTKKYSDVKLSVAGNEVVAHKCVLTSCSKVFAAMFEHDMEEAKTNKVYIADFDAETCNEMLRFMYTGKVLEIARLAPQLLAVSDIYHLDGLKRICADELEKNITVENAADTLTLAALYHEKDLKQHAIDFIREHRSAVVETKGWKYLLDNYSWNNETADESTDILNRIMDG